MSRINANPLLLGGLAVAIVIAIILFFNRPTVETIRTVTKVDTTYVVKAETVWVRRDTVIALPTPVEPDTIIIDDRGDSLATYKESYADSLVDIEVSVTVKGVLTDWRLRYSLHIPVVSRDTTVVIERDTETIKTIKQWSFNLGTTLLVTPSPVDPRLAIGPKFSLVLKDHKVVSYSYLSDGSHLVGITTPIITR